MSTSEREFWKKLREMPGRFKRCSDGSIDKSEDFIEA